MATASVGRQRTPTQLRYPLIQPFELAAEFLEELRRIDAQLRQTKKKLAVTVAAAGTSLTGLFGVGPVIAAAVIGDVRDVSRFPGRDHFAAYNGTAPIEVSSGPRKVYRLSRRGNRRLNHAVHMAAITRSATSTVVSSAPSLVHCHVNVSAPVSGRRTSAQARSMTLLTMGFVRDICTVPVLADISQPAGAALVGPGWR